MVVSRRHRASSDVFLCLRTFASSDGSRCARADLFQLDDCDDNTDDNLVFISFYVIGYW